MITYGLEHACRRGGGGDLTSSYLWTECRSGNAFLLVMADGEQIIGAAVVRIEQWTSGRKLRILCLYGERMADWEESYLDMLGQIARAGGATSLVTEGRAGWAKRYPKARVLRTVYEMDIKS